MATLDPWFVAFGRAVVAGLLAAVVLAGGRAPRPSHAQWRRLGLVVLGVVVGFPLCTSLALRELPAAHAIVVIGLLPASTAVAAVLRAEERPPLPFWLSAGAGVLAVLGFAAAGVREDSSAPTCSCSRRWALRPRLRGGRGRRTRARRRSDDLLGAGPRAPAHGPGHGAERGEPGTGALISDPPVRAAGAPSRRGLA